MWRSISSVCLSLSLSVGWSGTAFTQPIDQKLLLKFLSDSTVFTLVDSRDPGEFSQGHIRGAINIPHDQVADFRDQLPADVTAHIIVYCRTGNRAARLQSSLQELGYTNVEVLPAGQIFWSESAPPVFNCGVPAATGSLDDGLVSGSNPKTTTPGESR